MKAILILFTLVFSAHAGDSTPAGSPNQGSLVDAIALPEAGEGYIGMYRENERYWGTHQIINMIEKTASAIDQKFPGRDRLQVEDISQKNGGDISGHASHENGLDVDIGFYKSDSIEHDPILKNQMYADPMIIKGKVSPNFDLERNWELMKAFHKYGDVQKIFIDLALKKSLCAYAKKTGDYNGNINVLRSMRHEENHQDHLHVRLRCPKDAKKCINQTEPPPGAGC